MIARALRHIQAGEELCASYGPSYWKHDAAQEQKQTHLVTDLVYIDQYAAAASSPMPDEPKRRRMAPTPLHQA